MEACEIWEQLSVFEPLDEEESRTVFSKAKRKPDKLELIAAPYQYCDLTSGYRNLLGDAYWEIRSPVLESGTILNTGVAPRDIVRTSLASVLESHPDRKYYLSRTACLGILRRADERGKELPAQLEAALMAQAGLAPFHATEGGIRAYHINQRDEGIDLEGSAGALLATANTQMQTYVTGGSIAFAANQRDEVRDLHDVSSTICTYQTMKQQTFIAEGCLNPWDTQQKRIILPDSVAPTLASADGGGGRSPGGLLFSAAFSAGAGATACGIGYSEQIAPTLKGSLGGNSMPSVLCLNDQGGSVMEMSEDVTGTLRAQEHGHPPLVFNTHGRDSRFQGPAQMTQTIAAAFGMGGGNIPLIVGEQRDSRTQPLMFENHGIDARYTGPHGTAPTLPARAGTGGNNLPLVAIDTTEEETSAICITGNTIDRQPKNGGNGIGINEDVAFTLTATDRHAVFSRQRIDLFKPGDIVSTESARQHKDATDLVYQATVGALNGNNSKEPDSQYVGRDKPVEEAPLLIRRLTPLECERLQGFPDRWTDIPGSPDSARYKALGNSVAIPCVEFIMGQISQALRLF